MQKEGLAREKGEVGHMGHRCGGHCGKVVRFSVRLLLPPWHLQRDPPTGPCARPRTTAAPPAGTPTTLSTRSAAGKGRLRRGRLRKAGRKSQLWQSRTSASSLLFSEENDCVSEESIKKVLSKVNKLRLKNESKPKLTNSEVD